MNTKKSVYNLYMGSIYKWGILAMTFFCQTAAIYFTIHKLLGFYPDVSWTALIFFDVMDLSFLLAAVLLTRKSVMYGEIKSGRFAVGKCFTFIVLVIQWNYIIYMIPSGTFWGSFCLFVISSCFFLDIGMTLLFGFVAIISLILAWEIKGGNHFHMMEETMLLDFITLLTSMMLCLIGIVIFLFFMTHVQWMYQRSERQLELQKKYYQKVIEKDMGMQSFYHDMKKHIQALNGLCMENDFEAVKQYMEKLAGQSMQYNRVHTGNLLADCFVNGMIEDLLKQGELDWQVIGKFPPVLNVSESDFSVIFANALENAKEALEQIEGKRSFTLIIKSYKERVYITMKNTTASQDIPKGSMPRSRKRNGEAYGYGLYNMRLVLENNGGALEWTCENGVFQMDIQI